MERKKPKILVVDDEKNILNTIGICFESIGIDATLCAKPQDVLHLLQNHVFDIAFVDLKMSPMDGIEILEEIKQYSPQTIVIIMTAHGSVETAVAAIKKGAHDYLQKPFDFEELKLFTQKVLAHHQLVHEVAELRQELASMQGSGEIITRNRTLIEQLDIAARVAESAISILVEGESGTGKELVAHYIHKKSNRADKPFIKVNCAAIPEQLLESELFGHVRGAFTGALKDRQGRFELADSGTIFLDEIGELPSAIQSKLLRVLQTKDFERVGENVTRKVDVRVISATNRNLDEALKEGSFREDLFYRLNGVRIKLPSLRERPEDVPLLLHHFLKKFSKDREFTISPEADKVLKAYRWSGNVRELENVIERAALLAENGVIEPAHLPEEICHSSTPNALSLEEVEKLQIKKVLQISKDYDEAAHILGVDRKTLLNKRKKFGL
ncbi:MAG: sigma-54-dependent Fis family transcriptional regulator [Ignavibacteriae bacterium]|nr:MAG: sigma-54-dependent Fis family transcriptional regulator [Ignavibacteriota bacterium]